MVINVGRIGRCKGRPQFPGGMMLCVIFNSPAPVGARPLMAARRGVTAQEEKKSPTRTTARNPNARSFAIIISAVARGKILKPCGMKIVLNCSVFRKRNCFRCEHVTPAERAKAFSRCPDPKGESWSVILSRNLAPHFTQYLNARPEVTF